MKTKLAIAAKIRLVKTNAPSEPPSVFPGLVFGASLRWPKSLPQMNASTSFSSTHNSTNNSMGRKPGSFAR